MIGFLSKFFSLNGVDLVSLSWHRVTQRSASCQVLNTNAYVCICNEMSLWCLMQGSNYWVLFVIKEWLNRVILRILVHCVSFHIIWCHTRDGSFNFLLVFLAPLRREVFDLFFIRECGVILEIWVMLNIFCLLSFWKLTINFDQASCAQKGLNGR